MSKVEDYIKDCTRNCSNEMIAPRHEYQPWLTPDHARAVAEIAREEVIENLWHDASEEPVEEEYPIVVLDSTNCVYLIDKDDTEPFDLKDKWFSIHDILPKRY